MVKQWGLQTFLLLPRSTFSKQLVSLSKLQDLFLHSSSYFWPLTIAPKAQLELRRNCSSRAVVYELNQQNGSVHFLNILSDWFAPCFIILHDVLYDALLNLHYFCLFLSKVNMEVSSAVTEVYLGVKLTMDGSFEIDHRYREQYIYNVVRPMLLTFWSWIGKVDS